MYFKILYDFRRDQMYNLIVNQPFFSIKNHYQYNLYV